MPLVSDSPTLAAWLKDELKGSTCVVDLGAGFFDKLRFAPPMATKIGIEVFPAYLGYCPVGTNARLGDMRNWASIIAPKERDCAMLIDTIEHLPKLEGIALLRGLKDGGFRKILVMTPDGFVKQDEDVTGYGNEFQIHECGWTEGELEAEGFHVERAVNFHAHMSVDALFAVWNR
jgi:hypothetical protein